ncbi:hypothetical protein HDV04_001201 [Boothiomyces sp. JEL0838]|nr:hypothetical protein HDV04_001201 [Boothiomyces sp. JEL0838]
MNIFLAIQIFIIEEEISKALQPITKIPKKFHLGMQIFLFCSSVAFAGGNIIGKSDNPGIQKFYFVYNNSTEFGKVLTFQLFKRIEKAVACLKSMIILTIIVITAYIIKRNLIDPSTDNLVFIKTQVELGIQCVLILFIINLSKYEDQIQYLNFGKLENLRKIEAENSAHQDDSQQSLNTMAVESSPLVSQTTENWIVGVNIEQESSSCASDEIESTTQTNSFPQMIQSQRAIEPLPSNYVFKLAQQLYMSETSLVGRQGRTESLPPIKSIRRGSKVSFSNNIATKILFDDENKPYMVQIVQETAHIPKESDGTILVKHKTEVMLLLLHVFLFIEGIVANVYRFTLDSAVGHVIAVMDFIYYIFGFVLYLEISRPLLHITHFSNKFLTGCQLAAIMLGVSLTGGSAIGIDDGGPIQSWRPFATPGRSSIGSLTLPAFFVKGSSGSLTNSRGSKSGASTSYKQSLSTKADRPRVHFAPTIAKIIRFDENYRVADITFREDNYPSLLLKPQKEPSQHFEARNGNVIAEAAIDEIENI